MLKKLFISKVRIKVLRHYFSHFNEGFHVRGLVRILEEEINAVRRELLNLKDSGILQSEKQGNKVVYRIDDTCPILPDLRSLLFKTSDIGKQVIAISKKVDGVTHAILTSRYINKNKDIDVDILFIGKINLNNLSSEMKRYEKESKNEIRYGALTNRDFEFGKKNLDPFLIKILDNDNVILVGSNNRL